MDEKDKQIIEILKNKTEEKIENAALKKPEVDKITNKEIGLISATINDLSDEEGWAFPQ